MSMHKVYKTFKTEKELADWIRSRFPDGDDGVSDEFLVNESYSLEEWDFNEDGHYELTDKMLTPFKVTALMTIEYEQEVLAYDEDDIVLGETIQIDDMNDTYGYDSDISEIKPIINNEREV